MRSSLETGESASQCGSFPSVQNDPEKTKKKKNTAHVDSQLYEFSWSKVQEMISFFGFAHERRACLVIRNSVNLLYRSRCVFAPVLIAWSLSV